MEHTWKVVPLCQNQLKDVDTADIINNGLYRKCNIYKSGGGYDKLPEILSKRGLSVRSNQFVVQLQGCPFRCPYCYVTPDGIFGKHTEISTEQLVADFKQSNQDIFHLMGGAPALYIEDWHKIIKLLPDDKLFHSDLMLIEKEYTASILESISKENCIYAISIKGYSEESYLTNTGVKVDKDLLKSNLETLKKSKLNLYLTYTRMDETEVEKFKQWIGINDERVYRDSFTIKLIEYLATQ